MRHLIPADMACMYNTVSENHPLASIAFLHAHSPFGLLTLHAEMFLRIDSSKFDLSPSFLIDL